METEARYLTDEKIKNYMEYLYEQELASQTIQKYRRDLYLLLRFLIDKEVKKTELIRWKEDLIGKYAARSVNSMLAAANGFFNYVGWYDLKIKQLKIQNDLFCREEKELSKTEYARLVKEAQKRGNERLSLVIQTICTTGIRVSELQYITVSSLKTGHAQVSCKGKRRTVFLPGSLSRLLLKYVQRQHRGSGAVFVSRSGKPLDRSNIWKDMKSLCENAGVKREKVFPHNLRHLFARTYYSMEKDISRLADLLGHANITTTRIYTMESGLVHVKQLEKMHLIIT